MPATKMVKKVSVNTLVERVWDIEGYPNYFFGDDKQLYRYDSRGCLQQNKRIIIGYTSGYILKRKFFSLAQLRPLLRPHKTTNHLTDF
ncbi:hypothetical protein GCM10028774_04840 [Spirosoma jeollabukense]